MLVKITLNRGVIVYFQYIYTNQWIPWTAPKVFWESLHILIPQGIKLGSSPHTTEAAATVSQGLDVHAVVLCQIRESFNSGSMRTKLSKTHAIIKPGDFTPVTCK
jgi:hypothetical protein